MYGEAVERKNASVAAISEHNKIVVFGGSGGTAFLNDGYEVSLTSLSVRPILGEVKQVDNGVFTFPEYVDFRFESVSQTQWIGG